MAAAYRTMKAENEAIDYISKLIPNIHPNVKQADNKFNISNDTNNDKKVNYNDYMEYCKHNVTPYEFKSDTKVEELDDGNLKITNSGKAIESYGKNETRALKSTVEEFA